MSPTPPEPLSYAAAGVDVGAYAAILAGVRAAVEATHGPRVKAGLGPFAGLYELPDGAGHLAASADGVGTKIKVAVAAGRHRGIGEDLVNHCLNDVATAGARPLFLLDYFACGKLDGEVFTEVVEGVAAACAAASCALLGGETAEMPGLYALGDYDLAGFAVGLVPPGRLPDPGAVAPGDALLGLPSSGLHTNGFSLARRVFQEVPLDHVFPELGVPLGEAMLTPHRSYLGELEAAWPDWKAAAHVTGGGLAGNLVRCLPQGLGARVRRSWPVPPIFRLIQSCGPVEEAEMYEAFNMGVGMVLIAGPEAAGRLAARGMWRIGEVVEQGPGPRVAFA